MLLKGCHRRIPYGFRMKKREKRNTEKSSRGGDRLELVGMIKALYRHRQEQLEKGKKFYVSDERFFIRQKSFCMRNSLWRCRFLKKKFLPFIQRRFCREAPPIEIGSCMQPAQYRKN